MRLLTSQRENLLGVSQEQGKQGDMELRPCLMVALEIEPRPYGCCSPNTGWQNVGYHQHGLSYGEKNET